MISPCELWSHGLCRACTLSQAEQQLQRNTVIGGSKIRYSLKQAFQFHIFTNEEPAGTIDG
jgi:hypothetical protein